MMFVTVIIVMAYHMVKFIYAYLICTNFKNSRYELLYSYNRSQIFSILNTLTLQTELQNYVTNNVFLDNK